MTFDDDFLQAKFDSGDLLCRLGLKEHGLEWPPPPTMDLLGFKLERVRFSKITDYQLACISHVYRGAEYRVVGDEGGG